MDFVTWGRNPWGQDILIHLAWNLLYIAAAAGIAFMVAHTVWVRAFARPAPRPAPEEAARLAALEATLPKRVMRHSGAARLFHWVMAAAMLTLLITGFLPIVGVKFGWVTIHWISGLVLTASILYHIVHATFWLDFWSIWLNKADLTESWQRLTRALGGTAPVPRKPGKYPADNKLYHTAVIVTGFAAVVTGLFMLVRVETPFLTRNPYLFSDQTWGWMYVLHGLAGVLLVTLTVAHIYFAVRPEKLWITESMLVGSIDRQHYLEHHDPTRWVVPREAPEPQPAPGKRMTA
jgi:cytochrome b subunit of formate dehydrogenase